MQPLSEYPRPQFERDSYLSLNGEWEYKISKSDAIPTSFTDKIIVPYSPECEINNIDHILQPDEYLFYKKEFILDKHFVKDVVLLHFLAVDQTADVYLNGHLLGRHEGGFLPFHFEIQNYLEKKNTLILRVKDVTDTSYFSRGKQKLEHGGIWYTPQSGIWLPVFLESMDEEYIEDIKLTPDIDKKELKIKVKSKADKCLLIIDKEKIKIETNKEVIIPINNPHLWSIEDPYLYPLIVRTKHDEIKSYFAMRKFSVMKIGKYLRLALNNKPLFMKGVLDQGYYKKGLLTPTSYEDYIKDIELAKSLGFNTIRKHIKIEIPRWYYECDKRGMIVWQDFVNGGKSYRSHIITWPLFSRFHLKDTNYKRFGREDSKGREDTINEFKQTIDYLYNSPCIGLWTIFNEGWGQFDAKKIYEELIKIDNTRIYDHASGWHDQGIGNTKSLHVYFQPVFLPIVKKRSILLTEFGGLVLPIEGHIKEGNSVYKKFDDPKVFLSHYEKMIKRDVIKNIPKGLSASIYTQLSDVEEETNGFVTFDREVIKISPKEIKKINDLIHL